MGLPFRLFTGAYTFLMMSIALFILTCGILGKKIKGRPLAVFCIAAQVLQWLIGVVAPLLMLLASASDDMALSPAFDILTYTPVALFLGWQLAREFRLPFLHGPLPPRHLPLRVDVGQDAAVISAVNGVIEPEVDRGKLGKLPQGSLNAPRCQAFSGLSCGLRVLCRIFILPAA